MPRWLRLVRDYLDPAGRRIADLETEVARLREELALTVQAATAAAAASAYDAAQVELLREGIRLALSLRSSVDGRPLIVNHQARGVLEKALSIRG